MDKFKEDTDCKWITRKLFNSDLWANYSYYHNLPYQIDQSTYVQVNNSIAALSTWKAFNYIKLKTKKHTRSRLYIVPFNTLQVDDIHDLPQEILEHRQKTEKRLGSYGRKMKSRLTLPSFKRYLFYNKKRGKFICIYAENNMENWTKGDRVYRLTRDFIEIKRVK